MPEEPEAPKVQQAVGLLNGESLQQAALTNFSRTLPAETSDMAQELTKDPYSFAFTGITGRYNERGN